MKDLKLDSAIHVVEILPGSAVVTRESLANAWHSAVDKGIKKQGFAVGHYRLSCLELCEELGFNLPSPEGKGGKGCT